MNSLLLNGIRRGRPWNNRFGRALHIEWETYVTIQNQNFSSELHKQTIKLKRVFVFRFLPG